MMIFAQSHTVARIVIVSFGKRDEMGGIHKQPAIRQDYS